MRIVEPEEGYLACGMTGPGRLAAQEEILKAVRETAEARHDLAGETVLVTAGPTCEDLDPVRFHHQSFIGKDGLRGGGSGGAARGESDSGEWPDGTGNTGRN